MPKTLDEQTTGAAVPSSGPELPAGDIFSDVPTPLPEGTPIPPQTLAQLADYRALEEMAKRGEFKDFRGEYVIVLNGQLIAHGTDPEALRREVLEAHGDAINLAAIQYVY